MITKIHTYKIKFKKKLKTLKGGSEWLIWSSITLSKITFNKCC